MTRYQNRTIMQATVNRHKQAMKNIDKFRESLKGKKINVNKLLADNKKELEERTNRLIGK